MDDEIELDESMDIEAQSTSGTAAAEEVHCFEYFKLLLAIVSNLENNCVLIIMIKIEKQCMKIKKTHFFKKNTF